MRILGIAGLVLGSLLVLLGGLVAVTPARQYVPEMASRATEAVSPARPAAVTELDDVSQLKNDFNAAAGTPRLIMLFSPT